MHILVVGPGAMGCLFAARLKQAGFIVTLLDYIQERAESINKQGIMIEGITGEYTVNVPVVTGTLPSHPDFVLICVKAYKTKTASQSVKPRIGSDAAVITLQNGVGNLEILEGFFGKERVYGGVTAEGATLLGWGRVRHAGHGDTIMGPKRSSSPSLEKIIAAFKKAGFNTRSADNVDDLIWGKLIINVGINALTAILQLKNGRLPELAGTYWIMEEAVREATAVAKANGILLPYTDALGRVQEVCRNTAGNIASMLQDVLNKKITEVDFINGAIVQEGKKLGIPTPVNQTLTSLVKTIQETYLERL